MREHLVYHDMPRNAQATVSTATAKQTAASEMFYTNYWAQSFTDYASFEEGEFDFEKPIWQTGDSLSYVSQQNVETATVTLTPSDTYSGGGFTIFSLNKDYNVAITVTDNNGENTRSFRKATDGFYAFPFDGLQSAVFVFTFPTNHFMKVAAMSIGGLRIFTEADFVENPQIESHFSLTNEELAYDTLSFTIRGDRENFNFIAGEKIVHWGKSKEYFVASAKTTSDGTIEVEAYDGLALLDELDFHGIMRFNNAVKDTALLNTLFGQNSDFNALDYEVQGNEMNNKTFSGTISNECTRREALRIFMQGTLLNLWRDGNSFILAVLTNVVKGTFNESNIYTVPEIEIVDKITRVHFSQHKYVVDKSQGLVEAFRDALPLNEEIEVTYSQPFQAAVAKVAVGDTITDADPAQLLTMANGAYYKKLKNFGYNPSTYDVVVFGYPFKVGYKSIDSIPNVSNQFKENAVMISDCTMSLDDSESLIRQFYSDVYKFNYRISFGSLLNLAAGDYCNVDYNGIRYSGYITKKTDTFNGLYEYEVAAKWVGRI